MPTSRSRRIPKYRHYKPKNLAVVRINGKDHYLGRHNTPKSKEEYARLVAGLAARHMAHHCAIWHEILQK